MEFKVGAKVRCKDDGSIGVITKKCDVYSDDNRWWIKWETGEDAGYELFCHESSITVIEELPPEPEEVTICDAVMKFTLANLKTIWKVPAEQRQVIFEAFKQGYETGKESK